MIVRLASLIRRRLLRCPIYQASILFYKSIAGRYRHVSYPDRPITVRNRFMYNVYWVFTLFLHKKFRGHNSVEGFRCFQQLSPLTGIYMYIDNQFMINDGKKKIFFFIVTVARGLRYMYVAIYVKHILLSFFSHSI